MHTGPRLGRQRSRSQGSCLGIPGWSCEGGWAYTEQVEAEQRGASRNECRKQTGVEPRHEGLNASGRRTAFWLVVGEVVSLKILQWGRFDTE